jgi:hypothetical protein
MYSLAFDQSYMISPSTVESDMPEDRRSHSHNRRYGTSEKIPGVAQLGVGRFQWLHVSAH